MSATPQSGNLGKPIMAAVVVVAAVTVAHFWLSPTHPVWAWAVTMLACAAGAAWMVARQREIERGVDSRTIAALIRDVRIGQAPIEELSAAWPQWQPLAAEVQELCRELREQKRATAALQDEIRQRIANRTDALERMNESLRLQANRDALTGLHNRRMLDQLLPQLVNQCRSEGTMLAMLMIDVDYFKDLNDTLGHAAGDDLLRSLGRIIFCALRQQDAAFRFGGDEFVVLLPGCNRETARTVSDRLQSMMRSLCKAYKVPRLPRLSIGICTLADLAEPTAQNLLRRADEMLYACKSTRRRLPPPQPGGAAAEGSADVSSAAPDGAAAASAKSAA